MMIPVIKGFEGICGCVWQNQSHNVYR